MSNLDQLAAHTVLAERTAERDRARSVAVQLEQECHQLDTAIRALHQPIDRGHHWGQRHCTGCDRWWPCDTIRALDGAP